MGVSLIHANKNEDRQMFYEEKLIDGVLCSRGMPSENFFPISAEHMSDRIIRIENENADLEERLHNLIGALR